MSTRALRNDGVDQSGEGPSLARIYPRVRVSKSTQSVSHCSDPYREIKDTHEYIKLVSVKSVVWPCSRPALFVWRSSGAERSSASAPALMSFTKSTN